MLHQPKANVENIRKVIESIKADPDFDMASWTRCICGHCHIVMNSTEFSNWGAAYRFLGIDPGDGAGIFGNGDGRGKEWAINTLNDYLLYS